MEETYSLMGFAFGVRGRGKWMFTLISVLALHRGGWCTPGAPCICTSCCSTTVDLWVTSMCRAAMSNQSRAMC